MIFSPHLDDSTLSLGQFMAGRPDTIVANVFTGDPGEDMAVSEFDRNSGFRSPQEALAVRKQEDRAALKILQAKQMNLGFIDNQYRQTDPDLVPAFAELVEDQLAGVQRKIVLAPLGLAHPDHKLVAKAAVELVKRTTVELWFYEELPARVLWPEEVCPKMNYVSREHNFLGTGDRKLKAKAIRCYESQLWAIDPIHCLVPERVWRFI